jgi:hypothetical protein
MLFAGCHVDVISVGDNACLKTQFDLYDISVYLLINLLIFQDKLTRTLDVLVTLIYM